MGLCVCGLSAIRAGCRVREVSCVLTCHEGALVSSSSPDHGIVETISVIEQMRVTATRTSWRWTVTHRPKAASELGTRTLLVYSIELLCVHYWESGTDGFLNGQIH